MTDLQKAYKLFFETWLRYNNDKTFDNELQMNNTREYLYQCYMKHEVKR